MLAALRPGGAVSLSENVGVALGYIGKARQVGTIVPIPTTNEAVAAMSTMVDTPAITSERQAREVAEVLAGRE